VKVPEESLVLLNENVTLSSSSDNSEIAHSVATVQPGLKEESHKGKPSQLCSMRNTSSREQSLYSIMVDRFGVEQANEMAKAFGWQIKFIEN